MSKEKEIKEVKEKDEEMLKVAREGLEVEKKQKEDVRKRALA